MYSTVQYSTPQLVDANMVAAKAAHVLQATAYVACRPLLCCCIWNPVWMHDGTLACIHSFTHHVTVSIITCTSYLQPQRHHASLTSTTVKLQMAPFCTGQHVPCLQHQLTCSNI